MVALGMGEMREKVLLMDTVLDRMSRVWRLTLALDIAQKMNKKSLRGEGLAI